MTHRVTDRWFVICLIAGAVLVAVLSCNNPFGTRDPQKPDKITGVAIKPANSAENVIYNLQASFRSMSVQDYLNLFSDDFMFNPDPDDSVRYVEDFRSGWGLEKERTYAENFLQKRVTDRLEFLTHLYEYKAGDDLFDYMYSIKIFPAVDSTKVEETSTLDFYYVKGHSWIYLREDEEGKWRIYKWVDLDNMKEGAFITWGVLRQSNI